MHHCMEAQNRRDHVDAKRDEFIEESEKYQRKLIKELDERDEKAQKAMERFGFTDSQRQTIDERMNRHEALDLSIRVEILKGKRKADQAVIAELRASNESFITSSDTAKVKIWNLELDLRLEQEKAARLQAEID